MDRGCDWLGRVVRLPDTASAARPVVLGHWGPAGMGDDKPVSGVVDHQCRLSHGVRLDAGKQDADRSDAGGIKK